MHMAGISGLGTLKLPEPEVTPQPTLLATGQIPTLPYTGRFKMFSTFTNICNKKTRRLTLFELFTTPTKN
jgi:hypothetical protein